MKKRYDVFVRFILSSPLWVVGTSVLLWFLTPLLYGVVYYRLYKGKESPTRFKEKLGIFNPKNTGADVIWLHAVSVGETVLALAFIKAMRIYYPHHTFLLTTTTLTSYQVFERSADKHYIRHAFLPFDHPLFVRRFLEAWKPVLSIWMESEVWPHFIFALSRRHVPIVLVNGIMSAKSYKGWKKFSITRDVFTRYDVCLVQSARDVGHFKDLGARDVRRLGSLKLDVSPLPYRDDVVARMRDHFKGRTVWMASNIHHGEEQFILSYHQKLKEIYPDLLTVMAPRHPDKVGVMMDLFKRNNIKIMYSQAWADKDLADYDLLCVDEMGVLGDFYQAISVVLLGGSLIKGIGGHNILEPLKSGCSVVTGYYMDSYKEICEDLIACDALLLLSSDDMLAEVHQLLESKERRMQRITGFEKFNKQYGGGMTEAIQAIAPLVRSKHEK